jgi:uncharacterized membrane protein YgaE (UPF0421/DUF939 family)
MTIMERLTGKAKTSKLQKVVTLFVGVGIGLFFGQYFPDLYMNKVDEYVVKLDK